MKNVFHDYKTGGRKERWKTEWVQKLKRGERRPRRENEYN